MDSNNSNNNSNRASSSSLAQDIIQALQVQYAHVEEYCQAQTKLGNLLVTRGKEETKAAAIPIPVGHQEFQAIQSLDQVIQQVREDTVALETLVELYHQEEQEEDDITSDEPIMTISHHVQLLMKKHLDLSRRVLQTVREPFHSNGIPNVTISTRQQGGSNNQVQLVALATLRASMARLAEAVKGS
ncbi:hypothetical protein SEMRO_738_G195230.1 [Seminavis robusta]|uniref:Uncharacterized protein n=1 Tax=Seminavis robusta TaxID=568900 RepID=A0A9N8EC24_9STRA|nr:hypothetical protein SEMRO_738_G195230.1 [Seminavis robusta]|eukprot:Sro738_g195230.1 n/a (186) ;mRNA; f:6418-6975